MEYRGKVEEEIFEADGEPQSLQSSNLTEVTRNQVAPEVEIAISTEPLEVLDSFKRFQNSGGRVDQWTTADQISVKRGLESPWEKFLRLQNELKELQSDLGVMVNVEKKEKASLWEYLQAETERVIAESAAVGQNPAWERIREQNPGATEASVFQDLISKMQLLSNNASSTIPSQQAAPPVPREVLALEERLHRLEALVGQQSNLADLQTSVYPESIVHQASIGSSVPLIKVAQHLEERIALLDTKTLDTIKAKSKLLRSDLESLTSGSSSTSAGAATKAVSSAAANEIKIFEAAKKIEGFAERVRQIESVADDLPILAARLKTLETVHWNATATVQRLDELETQAKDLTSLLQSNDEVLAAMKQGLEDNLQVFQENVQQVEARLAALGK